MSTVNQRPSGSFGDASVEHLRPIGMATSAMQWIPPGYVDQDVSRFFYRWGGQLASTLIRIRSHFDGDLDQYLLYLTFLLAELSQVVSRADAEARGDHLSSWVHRGMNALSVADITLVPRETARRKLQLLVAGGYLLRGENGLYYLGDRYGLDAFFADLRPLFWDGLLTPRR
jgi:hypothetical protein